VYEIQQEFSEKHAEYHSAGKQKECVQIANKKRKMVSSEEGIKNTPLSTNRREEEKFKLET